MAIFESSTNNTETNKVKTATQKMNEILTIIENNCKGKMHYHAFYVLCKGLAVAAEKGNKRFVDHYLKKYFAEYVLGYNPSPNGKYGVMDFADPDLVMYDITGTINDFGYAVSTVAMEKGIL